MSCRQCWAPQAICHSYEPIDNSGRLRFRQGAGKCQFKGVLLEAVAVMIAVDNEERIRDWISEEARRTTVKAQRYEDVKGWLGSSVTYGGVEMSGMCYLFYVWASKEVGFEGEPASSQWVF